MFIRRESSEVERQRCKNKSKIIQYVDKYNNLLSSYKSMFSDQHTLQIALAADILKGCLEAAEEAYITQFEAAVINSYNKCSGKASKLSKSCVAAHGTAMFKKADPSKAQSEIFKAVQKFIMEDGKNKSTKQGLGAWRRHAGRQPAATCW